MNQGLLEQLKADFSDITFREADSFYWNYQDKTVFFNPEESDSQLLLLHELGHACLGHSDYTKDIELLQMEVAAWGVARELAKKYTIPFSESLLEDAIETYRDWLHKRSLCPRCDSSGIQESSHYLCPLCRQRWQPNEAKHCRLLRKRIAK